MMGSFKVCNYGTFVVMCSSQAFVDFPVLNAATLFYVNAHQPEGCSSSIFPFSMTTSKDSGALLPVYLNESLILRSLESGLEYPRRVAVKVNKFLIRSATTAGDNYLSDVFRMWVSYKRLPGGRDEEISLIVKCLPDKGHRGSIVGLLNAFDKEVKMFRTIVPELSALVDNELFAAKLYYATTDPIRMIVFQDLNAIGFTMADRTGGGLDYDHCVVIMRKIAKFHASSLLLAASGASKRRELEEQFEYGFMNPHVTDDSNTVLDIFASGFDTLIGCAEKWSEFDRCILDKLKTMRPRYRERVVACLNQKFSDGFKVINHGDLWINNILFRYGLNGRPEEAIFVDYQLSVYTSPGIDLNYSLVNCPTFEVREHQRGNLIKEYHSALAQALKGSNVPIPSLADVQLEIKRMSYFSLVAAISILPIVTMESVADLDISLDAMVDESKAKSLRQFQYNGDRYRKAITKLMTRFDRDGLLD
ncbi:uncharacterized protein LOC129730439 [Wyeomyia smithii]|uniref:uncharacterized protein LOC129730439 n=1 Tax=Wyeomyia smithii TaxID=174621 RepID=UPI00246818D6|nr:uncharacterized protein LOC129730439 [Wyeomyia smithii]